MAPPTSRNLFSVLFVLQVEVHSAAAFDDLDRYDA